MATKPNRLSVRPYQLLCTVCRLGSGGKDAYSHPERLDQILAAVRNDPNVPVTLRCNVDTVYSYQNPGREFDTPEGELFNDKRDLDIVQRLGLVPGDTRPALEMFNRLFKDIPSCRGICGYDQVTSAEWRGCRLAASGNYERGHAMGVGAVIPPRNAGEKAQVKTESCKRMYEAGMLEIRPHHLMCMSCFHGGRDKIAPIQEDNLFEAIDIIRKNPRIPVRLVPGPCMVCPPCSKYQASTNWCIGGIGAGLRDQKKDLDVLQRLGLKFGDVLPACELYQRLYDRIHSTRQICGYDDGVVRGQEWTICGGPEGAPGYAKARSAGLGIKDVMVSDGKG
jgi:hypothetical protein